VSMPLEPLSPIIGGRIAPSSKRIEFYLICQSLFRSSPSARATKKMRTFPIPPITSIVPFVPKDPTTQTLLPIKLEKSKSEERLTSLAGLIVVEELARAKGLWRRVEELFPKPGSGRGYRASAYVKPLVWMLQAGGRRLEDVR